jgi:hypothetical protein
MYQVFLIYNGARQYLMEVPYFQQTCTFKNQLHGDRERCLLNSDASFVNESFELFGSLVRGVNDMPTVQFISRTM